MNLDLDHDWDPDLSSPLQRDRWALDHAVSALWFHLLNEVVPLVRSWLDRVNLAVSKRQCGEVQSQDGGVMKRN